MSHRSGQYNTLSYYQDVCHDERARDANRDLLNGQGELEDSPQPPRRKMTQKCKSKTTLQDIKAEEDVTSNKKLKKKDYTRPDVIKAKQTELEKFFKFNIVETVPHAPGGAEIMRTTWVVT